MSKASTDVPLTLCRGEANRKRTGFTLIELMMVVIIIGILAAMVLPKFTGSVDRARKKIAEAGLSSIAQALERYEMENGAYPSSDQGLKALMDKPTGAPTPQDWNGPYLSIDPSDPWGHSYGYRYPSTTNNSQGFDIWSAGPDGKEGTEDDITNARKQ
jgi:general secretion pathway protein G